MCSTLFIGINAPANLINIINSKSSNSAQISVAAIKYSRLISEGFEMCNKQHKSLFLVPIGMFPSSKVIFFHHQKDSNKYYIPFINIILLKQICIAIYTFLFILKWNFEFRREEKYVLFGCLYFPFLVSIIGLKFQKKIKVISFIPDLPQYMFSYTEKMGSLKRIFQRPYVYITCKVANFIDYYVFITKYMEEHFPSKPYTVIEGFTDYNLTKFKLTEISEIGCRNAVMYAGALFKNFGILTLIDAFMVIEGDYELWLFGYGDLTDEILLKSKIDNRIKFFGNVSNEIVLDYEKKARLLVNPRPTNHEFTKYSFPSKILEYMTSGTPVLTTRLKGIPEEYERYLYFFDDFNFEDIKNGLEQNLKISDDELFNFGIAAMNFAIKEKNNKTQISRLLFNL